MTKLSIDDDTFERDLFRARAERMPKLALPSVDAVIARGQARRRARAVAFVPPALSRISKTLARTAGPIAMMHAAAGIFVFVAWGAGVHVERVRPDVGPAEHAPMMSLEESPGTTGGTCEAAASLFGLTCESLPASMPITMRERASCDAPTHERYGFSSAGGVSVTSTFIEHPRPAVCEGSFVTCGDSVTCADDRP